MNITLERWWIFIGLAFGLLPVIGLTKTYSINLQVLAIFFGTLLAIAAIIYSAWESETLKRLRKTGHDRYLIEYIMVPSYLDFVLIIMQLGRENIYISASLPYYSYILIIFGVLTYALGGVLILSMLRILFLLEPIMRKDIPA